MEPVDTMLTQLNQGAVIRRPSKVGARTMYQDLCHGTRSL